MAPSLTGGVRPRLAPGPGACTGHVRPPSVLSSSCEDGQPVTQPPPPPPLDGQWPEGKVSPRRQLAASWVLHVSVGLFRKVLLSTQPSVLQTNLEVFLRMQTSLRGLAPQT